MSMRPHIILLDVMVVFVAGFVAGLLLGPFLHLLFGLPGGVDAAGGLDSWSFALRSSSGGYALGAVLSGLAWFSLRRHRVVRLRLDTLEGPRHWFSYGTGVTLTALVLPILAVQSIFFFVARHFG